MNAQTRTAGGTSPPDFFLAQECFKSVIVDEIKVFNHAHSIFCPVSFIEVF
ncbi:MAG: hypothetical protein JEZ03_14000 [Bacteroidales bacterium]|nr:hypothetical protein [Bacteroidales bacterium]